MIIKILKAERKRGNSQKAIRRLFSRKLTSQKRVKCYIQSAERKKRKKAAVKSTLPGKAVLKKVRRDEYFPRQTKAEGIYHY